MITQQEIRELVDYTCDELRVPGLSKVIKIIPCHTMTSRMGTAVLRRSWRGGVGYEAFKGELKYSTKIFELTDKEEQSETIVHETCHIVAQYIDPKREHQEGLEGHGAFWRSLMNKLGYEGKRYHCVDTTPISTLPAYCSCRTWQISKQRYGRIRNGTSSYLCQFCNTRLRLTNVYAKNT
jgi:SprT protein